MFDFKVEKFEIIKQNRIYGYLTEYIIVLNIYLIHF